MKAKLTNLHNAMYQIETKGNNTLIMADCIKYLEQCIRECEMVPLGATEKPAGKNEEKK